MKNNDVSTTVRMPKEVLEKLRAKSIIEYRSISETVRMLVEAYVELPPIPHPYMGELMDVLKK